MTVAETTALRRACPQDGDVLSRSATGTFARAAEGLLPIEDLADYIVSSCGVQSLRGDLLGYVQTREALLVIGCRLLRARLRD